MLFGIGYDIHRLVENRKLVLGAAALGDIGEHFPDTDQRWKGVPSKTLLLKVVDLVKEKRFKVNNVDVVILAEKPKIGSKKIEMKKNIAEWLGVDANRGNIKAQTMEGVDAIGRGEAIAAQAIASLC